MYSTFFSNKNAFFFFSTKFYSIIHTKIVPVCYNGDGAHAGSGACRVQKRALGPLKLNLIGAVCHQTQQVLGAPSGATGIHFGGMFSLRCNGVLAPALPLCGALCARGCCFENGGFPRESSVV